MDPLEIRGSVRAFALGLPGAYEEFPWGESVIKVAKKVFVFLGTDDGSRPPAFNIKLKDPDQHAHALSLSGAERMGYGLGQHGWVYVPFGEDETPVEMLCDWIEESYRSVAPKTLVAEYDARP